MIRNPTTFAYPVVYPNGVIVYCETEEEQQTLMYQLQCLLEDDDEEEV